MTGDWPPPPGPTDRTPPPPPLATGARTGPGRPDDGRRVGIRGGVLVALAVVVVVAVGVLAVPVIAGGDDDRDGPPAGLTLDELEGALLTLDDVGGDYEVQDDEAMDLLDSDSLEASDECRLALERFRATESSGETVSAHFANDVDGSVQHDISLPADGHPSLGDSRRGMDECSIIEVENDGMAQTMRYETHDVDGLGDDAFGTVIDVEQEAASLSIPFEIYSVTWERDGVVSIVTGFAGFDEETVEGLPADRDEVERLAATADERLAGVLAG